MFEFCHVVTSFFIVVVWRMRFGSGDFVATGARRNSLAVLLRGFLNISLVVFPCQEFFAITHC